VASLIEDTRVVIYDHNMFIIQATGSVPGKGGNIGEFSLFLPFSAEPNLSSEFESN
jgi:hypothetical protein